MPRITGIWWRPFRIPLRRPILAAHGSIEAREGIVIGIRTTDGEGLGEISPLPSFAGGDIGECAGLLPGVARALLGQDLAASWDSGAEDRNRGTRGSRAATACGIETAIADLLAQGAGQPLWLWLASSAGLETTESTPFVPVNALIDALEPHAAATEAEAAVAAGFCTLKIKVGRDAPGDEERIAAVREAAGPGVALRVDANGAWEIDEAIGRLTSYVAHDVALVEQPTSAARPDAVDALRRVRANVSLQVAADEACTGPAAARTLIEADAVDAFVVKPMMVGLRNAAEILAIGASAGIPAIATTSFEAGIGTAAAIHLAAALPAPRLACGLSTLTALAFDIAAGVPSVEAGGITAPRGPGLGVRLDEAMLERAATGSRTALGDA